MNPAGNVPVKVENDVPEVAKVEEAKSNPQPAMEEQEPEAVRKLFVGGVSLNTTDENLHAFYGQFGPITDCIVMRDPATKRSRGFGFVTFEKKADLDKAMESRPHQIDGKVVDPKRAVPREQQKTQPVGSSHRLYIAGLQDMHTEEVLTNYFTKYGKVERCDVLMDKATGRPRGFAFVTFADYDSVDRALLELHTIEDIRCQVKKAFSKDGANRASQSRERPRGFNPRASYGSHSAGQWSSSAGGYGGGGAAYASYGYAGYPSSQNYPPTYSNSVGSYGTTSQGAWTTLPAWGQSSNWGQPQGGWGPGGAQSSTYQQPAAAPFSPTSSTNAWDPYHNSAGTAHGYGSRNQF